MVQRSHFNFLFLGGTIARDQQSFAIHGFVEINKTVNGIEYSNSKMFVLQSWSENMREFF